MLKGLRPEIHDRGPVLPDGSLIATDGGDHVCGIWARWEGDVMKLTGHDGDVIESPSAATAEPRPGSMDKPSKVWTHAADRNICHPEGTTRRSAWRVFSPDG